MPDIASKHALQTLLPMTLEAHPGEEVALEPEQKLPRERILLRQNRRVPILAALSYGCISSRLQLVLWYHTQSHRLERFILVLRSTEHLSTFGDWSC